MTDHHHPITPPPELIGHWLQEWIITHGPDKGGINYVVVQAAQYGADQELEACCEWLAIHFAGVEKILRAARRPKPASLKEQAQSELNRLIALIPSEGALAMAEPIRRALEALDD